MDPEIAASTGQLQLRHPFVREQLWEASIRSRFRCTIYYRLPRYEIVSVMWIANVLVYGIPRVVIQYGVEV